MNTTRKSYPSDVADAEWEFLLPYLTLMRGDAPQRSNDMREVFNAIRYVVKTGCQWRLLPHDLPEWTAVDTMGNLLALKGTAANEQEREQVAELAAKVQEVTGGTVEIAFVDQGYTGENAAKQASKAGIELEVVKHTEAKRKRSVAGRTAGNRSTSKYR